MYSSNLVLLFSFAVTVASSPAAPNPQNGAVNCNKVNGALSVLRHLGPPATSFCRSYLNIPATITQTTTLAPVVVTTTTGIVTVTNIESDCPVLTERHEPAENEKRHNLPALRAFAASQLSSGCRCLNLGPKTTATRTITPPASTTSVVATTTACITCTPSGIECTFDRPDLCCSRACRRVLPPVPGGPEATCI